MEAENEEPCLVATRNVINEQVSHDKLLFSCTFEPGAIR